MASYSPARDFGDLSISSKQPGTPTHRLNPEQERVIQRNYKFLVDNLDTVEVLDHMISDTVLSFQDRDYVINGEGSRSPRGQARRFLDCLLRGGEPAYQSFLLALKETGQRNIVATLEGSNIPEVRPPSYDACVAAPSAPMPDWRPQTKFSEEPEVLPVTFFPMTATPKSLHKIKPKIDKFRPDGDVEKCWITNLLITASGRLVMLDRANMKVKVAWMTAVTCVKLDVRPWALAKLDNDTVAVTSLDNVILVVDIKPDQPVVKDTIRTTRRYRGVGAVDPSGPMSISALYRDNLIVCCPAEGNAPASLDVIDRDGNVVHRVEVRDFCLPDYLYVHKSEVLVSDSGANAVFRVDISTGHVTNTLVHEHLKYPTQVCADRADNVYVLCHDSRRVLVTDGSTWKDLIKGDKHGEAVRDVPYCMTVTDQGVVWIGWGAFGEDTVLRGYQL